MKLNRLLFEDLEWATSEDKSIYFETGDLQIKDITEHGWKVYENGNFLGEVLTSEWPENWKLPVVSKYYIIGKVLDDDMLKPLVAEAASKEGIH